jgi:hypothetical protein
VNEARGEESPELERWLARCDEVLALFDCALRGCRMRSYSVVKRSLAESMRCLELERQDVTGRMLALFEFCLTESEQGRFEEAEEVLLDLKESWARAVDTIRKERRRASHLH